MASSISSSTMSWHYIRLFLGQQALLVIEDFGHFMVGFSFIFYLLFIHGLCKPFTSAFYIQPAVWSSLLKPRRNFFLI
jgi:hypothetical protein